MDYMSIVPEEPTFVEFSEALTLLNELCSTEVYLEALDSSDASRDRFAKRVIKNTNKTVHDITNIANDEYRPHKVTNPEEGPTYGQSHNTIFTPGANAIKSVWDLMAQVAHMAAIASNYIIDKLSGIPQNITNMLKRIQRIPSEVQGKVRGDINLYITKEDITYLYSTGSGRNPGPLRSIDKMIGDMVALEKNQFWTSFFHRINRNDENGLVVDLTSSKHIIDDLARNCKTIDNLKFSKTQINISDPNTRNVYLGTGKSVQFVDLQGQTRSETYLAALDLLMKDLQRCLPVLRKYKGLLNEKYLANVQNGKLARLGKKAQDAIVKLIPSIGKVINVIGDVVKYTIMDMNTINKVLQKIQANTDKQNKKAAKKAARAAKRRGYEETQNSGNEENSEENNKST